MHPYKDYNIKPQDADRNWKANISRQDGLQIRTEPDGALFAFIETPLALPTCRTSSFL